MRSAHALVLTMAALALVGAGPVGDEADLARGRALGDLTSAESLRSLAAAATPQLAGVIERAGGPAAMAAGLGQQLGAREAKLDENVLTLNGATVYRRLDRHAQGLAVTTLAWTADGKASAAQVRPAPAAPTATTWSTPVRTTRRWAVRRACGRWRMPPMRPAWGWSPT